MSETTGPMLANIHHLALTVTDVDASLSCCERVLRFERETDVAHHEAHSAGHAVLLRHPVSGLTVVPHHHDANGKDGRGQAHQTRRGAHATTERRDGPAG